MVKFISLVTVLICSLMLGGGAFAQDRDRTRDTDKTGLHEPDRLKTQDKLHAQDKDLTKDMIRARDQDKLHTPSDSDMKRGPGTGSGAGRGRR